MGYTFSAALIRKLAGKAGSPSVPETRAALRRALEGMGCRRLKTECETLETRAMSLLMWMHHRKGCGWLALKDDKYFGDPEMAEPLLMRLASALGQTVLYVAGDGSGLRLWATDGQAAQRLCCGAADAVISSDCGELTLFDALLPDDGKQTELRRLAAAEYMDAGLAVQRIGQLFGFGLELLMPQDGSDCGILQYELPPELRLWRQNADKPAALHVSAAPALTNPASIEVHSVGGTGRGIRIWVQAVGYDAAAVEMPVAALIPYCVLEERPAGVQLTAEDYLRAVPQRCNFCDGGSGWRIDLPEAEIPAGVRAIAVHGRGQDSVRATFSLWLPFCFEEGLAGTNLVRIESMENPQAGTAVEFALTPFRKPWLGSYPWMADCGQS